jgi:hypothetical protein
MVLAGNKSCKLILELVNSLGPFPCLFHLAYY